ncbi:HU domain-containing protein [Maribacter ulvicola]|uniref:Sporulation related domain-containing protein n=1 Tax=Maribacter ulvicola TaxID=228959 RepID=A0A1N6PMX6_9FLAO|nr:SPOR domain-containing protein [Maribacter ulvicola]SIQ05748.1 Sporulation related domain-containing protein [Maribacter ulvicola]
MILEHYISDLLYRYNCVVVPGFGAFLTQKNSAKLNVATNTFSAPNKSIVFNRQLVSNDGLLVSYVSNAEKVSYETALVKIENQVKSWQDHLIQETSLHLKNIGSLSRNIEDKILFQPVNETNYLTSSFGLSNFNSLLVTREVLKEEVIEIEEKTPFVISPERRATRGFRPFLKYAAILMLAFSTGVTGYRAYQQQRTNEKVAIQDAQEFVNKQIQEATFFDLSPLELPTVTVDASSKSTAKSTISKVPATHFIVAGAFRIKDNADRKIAQLKANGFNAGYYGTNAFGLHMVTFNSYTNANDALKALREIKRTQSKDAWLLTEK